MTAVGALIQVKHIAIRDRLHFQIVSKVQAPGTQKSLVRVVKDQWICTYRKHFSTHIPKVCALWFRKDESGVAFGCK